MADRDLPIIDAEFEIVSELPALRSREPLFNPGKLAWLAWFVVLAFGGRLVAEHFQPKHPLPITCKAGQIIDIDLNGRVIGCH